MIFDVSHRTTYAYRKPVLQSQHLVHLTPRGGERQMVDRHSLLIEPAPSSQVSFNDYFGNGAAILTIDDEHSEFVIHARSTVEVWPPDLPILALSTPWEQVCGKAVRSDGTLDIDVLQFVSTSRHTQTVPEALDYARRSFRPPPGAGGANDLTQRMYADFIFDSKATHISTRCRRCCATGAVCARTSRTWRSPVSGPWGCGRRYVSGDLLTLPPPGMEKLQGADASHAWLSVWTPRGAGSTSTDEWCDPDRQRHDGGLRPRLRRRQPGQRRTARWRDERMTVAVDVTPVG